MKRTTQQKLIKKHCDEIITHLGYDLSNRWKLMSKAGLPYPNRRVCVYPDDAFVRELDKSPVDFMIITRYSYRSFGNLNVYWELLMLNKTWATEVSVNGWSPMMEHCLKKSFRVDLDRTPEEIVILADMDEL